MKKPLLPRIISLTVLYAGVFVLLVAIQFTNQRSFTQRIGDFVVSGHYSKQANNEPELIRPLEGTITISYGGIEFLLTDEDDDDGLSVLHVSGEREVTRPLFMSVSAGAARFPLRGGAEITFSTQNIGGNQELRIFVSLPEGSSRLELPYRLLGSSRIRRHSNGESHLIANGKSYRFNSSLVDFSRRLVFLDANEPVVSYGQVQGTEVHDPSRFILSIAQDKRMYDEALIRWRDQSFTRWGQSIAASRDEETILAYLSEAVSHGGYRSALTGISPEFAAGNQRTFESSVFLGRLDMGLRSNAVFERENLSRLTRLIEGGSTDILKESHVIEFLALRGQNSLIDALSGIIRSLDSAELASALLPGILEGYMDWQVFRPNTENPFNTLMNQVCFAVSEGIIMNDQDGQIFVFDQGTADMEFNLRVGAGLAAYGEYVGQEVWGGIGRSLVLSVLSLVGESGTAPLTLTLSLAESGDILPTAADANPLSAARIYRQLRLGDYSVRAVGLGSGSATNGIWTWTAAAGPTANFNQESNFLDISVSFPSGETHYMLIRGIRPFTQIQLYNIPFRTDPQFERYDSSGWAYSPSEQTLMVKMKHRLTTEHILIYY
ncbi:hypothetical protein AGMMS49942_15790 [Spirochaetia bacterium]|nr:hypothetical protein AGMMS49942_15790 [Spirochaetia bacterium]